MRTSALVPVFVSLALGVIAQADPRAADAAGQQATIACGSNAGQRQTCSANTAGGVTLVKPLGDVACELGRNMQGSAPR